MHELRCQPIGRLAWTISLLCFAPIASAVETANNFLGEIEGRRSLIELKSKYSDEDFRAASVLLLIDDALRIQRTRDLSIDMASPPALWPVFDARIYGSNEVVFSGEDPSAIKDPKVQAAYRKALSDNKLALEKHVSESRKQEVTIGCLRAAHRVIQFIQHPQTKNDVLKKIDELNLEPTFKGIVLFGRLPTVPESKLASNPVHIDTHAVNPQNFITSALLIIAMLTWLIRRHFTR